MPQAFPDGTMQRNRSLAMPSSTSSAPGDQIAASKQIGLFAAVAIGIGGMVGGGVYAIFGAAATPTSPAA